jgi:hypothetical protein
LDVHEIMAVEAENKYRAQVAAEQRREAGIV